MYRIAISGHRGLPDPTAGLVDEALRAALTEHAPDVTGLSCLADGADQIFARAVTDLGGTLEAVIPADEYRENLPEDSHPGYDELFARAAAVHRLPFTESTPESHMAASKLMVDEADELYAVWDGKPARAYGGTADVGGLRTRARHPRARDLARRRTARLTAGQARRRPYRCRRPQIYLRCTCHIPGPAASVGDLRCRGRIYLANRQG
jgi:hypothetical protein